MKYQQPFITLVDQILATQKKDPNSDTSALEKQIDKMVYELYGLTPEEIAIVERKDVYGGALYYWHAQRRVAYSNGMQEFAEGFKKVVKLTGE